MSRISGAIVNMVLSRQLILVLSGIGLVVLARLLDPADFGIFATAQATFLLLELAIRFGLAEFLISAPRVSTSMMRSALGLSLAIAAAVSALVLGFALTPLSAWLDWDLRLALAAMVPGLIAIPLGLLPEAIRRRRLDFALLSWLGVGGAAADVGVACALALLGAGPLALVSGMVASRILSSALLVALSGRLLAPRIGGWKRFWPFAPHMTATTLLPKTSDLGVVLIIPGALGVAALGLYNRAQTIILMLDRTVLDGVAPVVLPAISERLRAGAPVAEVYGAKTARMTVLTWPVFAVIPLLAEPLVLLLLGDKWGAAVPVVQILCAIGIAVPFTSMSLQFFAATDRLPQYLRIQSANQVVRLACVAVAALVFHSLEAVAWGVVAGRLFKAVHVRHHLVPVLGHEGARARRRDYARAGVVALLSLAGPALLLFALPGGSPAVLAIGGIALAAAGWLAGVVVTRHPLLGDLRALPIVQRAEQGGLARIWG